MKANSPLVVLGLSASLCAIACKGASAGGTEGSLSAETTANLDKRSKLLAFTNRYMHANYMPLTAEDVVKNSDVVVRGRLHAAHEGRAISTPRHKTAVLEVAVSETVKGPKQGPTIYVELVVGGIPADQLEVEDSEVLLFLVREAKRWKGVQPIGRLAGLPGNASIYGLVSRQGIVMDSGSGIGQPLADEEELQLFSPLATIGEVASAVAIGDVARAGGTTGDSRALMIKAARAELESLPRAQRERVSRAPSSEEIAAMREEFAGRKTEAATPVR